MDLSPGERCVIRMIRFEPFGGFRDMFSPDRLARQRLWLQGYNLSALIQSVTLIIAVNVELSPL